mmetsp:Transcript_39102/g.112387  ORF Transcript_39102/g.112387 Transcript_39102/m.112387 type:complete len:616 (+) Transcript_39102:2-1849(+)
MIGPGGRNRGRTGRRNMSESALRTSGSSIVDPGSMSNMGNPNPGGQPTRPGSSPLAKRRDRKCATLGTSTQAEALDILAPPPRRTWRQKYMLSGGHGLLAPDWGLDGVDQGAGSASFSEVPKRFAAARKRESFDLRSGMKLPGGPLSPNGDDSLRAEPAKVGAPCSGDISVACTIVDSLLQQQGILTQREKEQLRFVRDILQSCASTFKSCASTFKSGAATSKPCDPKEEMLSKLGESGLDEQTRAFLEHFADQPLRQPKKTLRPIAQAIMFTRALRGKSDDNSDSMSMGRRPSMEEEMEKVDSWEDFDVFALDEATQHRPLACVAKCIVHARGLSSFFLPLEFRAFVREIEGQYFDRPYHNRLHAADVTQGVHVMLADTCTELHLAATIFAAICHDVGHPGVTNAFRVTVADEMAITYNDKSVNENMHAAMAYRTLQLEGCGCFSHLNKDQYASIRKLAIGMILSTDMAGHVTSLKGFKTSLEDSGPDLSKWEKPELALQWVLHTADISSTARPFTQADLWTTRLLDEFFQQGDAERELGIPVSPLCDKRVVEKTSSQLGFINFIVKPSLEVLEPMFKVRDCLENLQIYVDKYNERLAEEKAEDGKRSSTKSTK